MDTHNTSVEDLAIFDQHSAALNLFCWLVKEHKRLDCDGGVKCLGRVAGAQIEEMSEFEAKAMLHVAVLHLLDDEPFVVHDHYTD